MPAGGSCEKHVNVSQQERTELTAVHLLFPCSIAFSVKTDCVKCIPDQNDSVWACQTYSIGFITFSFSLIQCSCFFSVLFVVYSTCITKGLMDPDLKMHFYKALLCDIELKLNQVMRHRAKTQTRRKHIILTNDVNILAWHRVSLFFDLKQWHHERSNSF